MKRLPPEYQEEGYASPTECQEEREETAGKPATASSEGEERTAGQARRYSISVRARIWVSSA
jgi:hypothetical protein